MQLFIIIFFVAIPLCGEYNFSISAINTTREFIITAELHLYLQNIIQITDKSSNQYIAGISAVGQDGQVLVEDSGKPIKDTEFFNVGSGDQYVVFELVDMLKKLIDMGKPWNGVAI